MMTVRSWFIHLPCALCCLLMTTGCGNRQQAVHPTTVAAKPAASTQPILAVVFPATRVYCCPQAQIQFAYPADWQANSASTSLFSVTAPAKAGPCSLSLDVPKLPWHPPGLLTLGMIASQYERDLRKTLMPDAMAEQDDGLTVAGAPARRIISSGHHGGKSVVDMAVIAIHNDRIYILSTDCDAQNRRQARQALDDALTTLKWGN